jgi:ACS family hexuronate transporter-like MFS transporter
MGVLAPTLRDEFGWTFEEYGSIASAFTLAYAIGFLFAGWFIDRVGTRFGYAAYLVVWSIAAAAHALARGVGGFWAARFALGVGESGNFPAAVKTAAEWFPAKERAFAIGIFNSGTSIGAVIAPAIVPWIALTWGWQEAFLITGAGGLVWVFFWWPLYRRPSEHPKISAGELAHIESDPPDPIGRVPWLHLLRFRQTWAFALGKFITDSVWWFYLGWFALFLADFGVSLCELALPMITVFVLADVGAIGGGWLSSRFLKRGWGTNAARKIAMLICACSILPVILAPHMSSAWPAIFLVGVAMAGHQGFSSNLFTITTDMFPRHTVASIVGIGGFCGAMGGFIMNLTAGSIRDNTGSFAVVFLVAGLAYFAALLIIHLCAPRLEPINPQAA